MEAGVISAVTLCTAVQTSHPRFGRIQHSGVPIESLSINTNLPHVREEHESMTRCCTPVVGLVDVRFIVSLAELLSTTGDTYSESGLLSYAIRNKLPRCHSAKKGGTESVNNTSCEFHAS